MKDLIIGSAGAYATQNGSTVWCAKDEVVKDALSEAYQVGSLSATEDKVKIIYTIFVACLAEADDDDAWLYEDDEYCVEEDDQFIW